MEMVSSFGFHGELFLGQSKNVQMACNSFYFPKFQGKWILLRDFRPLLTKTLPHTVVCDKRIGDILNNIMY